MLAEDQKVRKVDEAIRAHEKHYGIRVSFADELARRIVTALEAQEIEERTSPSGPFGALLDQINEAVGS
jgi:hypothetical protein